MNSLLLSFFVVSLSLILTSCEQQHNIRPKSRPQAKKVVTKQERSQKIKELPAPQRRKVEHVEARQHEQELAYINSPIKDLTYEQLKVTKDALLAEEDLLGVRRYIERMLVVSTDLNDLKDLRLEIADINFDLGDLEKAETYYNDYISFYPGSDLLEYATYKAILSCFYQTLESDRDQSKTRQSINLAESFLKQESYKTYTEDVKSIQELCTARAFESELNVFNFYVSQNKLKAAHQRLDYIKEHFTSKDTAVLLPILTAEATLAQSEGNVELYNLKQKEITALNAQENKKDIDSPLKPVTQKKNYANRF